MVYDRMRLAGDDGVKACINMRRLAAVEADRHVRITCWLWGEQVLIPEAFAQDTASHMALRAQFWGTPCGFEAHQTSDYLTALRRFQWTE